MTCVLYVAVGMASRAAAAGASQGMRSDKAPPAVPQAPTPSEGEHTDVNDEMIKRNRDFLA